MRLDELIARVGRGEMIADDVFYFQIGLLTLVVLFFLASLVLCVMSVRAAGGARSALKRADELAAEMRHLTAQVELSTKRAAAVRPLGEQDAAAIGPDGSADRSLEAAKEAVTVPTSLVRGRFRLGR